MKIVKTILLGALILPSAIAGSVLTAHAQGHWVGDRPVFQSEIQRREREQQARRAERKKSYNVSYPAFMKGGAKPDIAAEKPDIVYLEGNEEPGTIIIDTTGRKLYFVLPEKRAYAYPISVGREGFSWTGTERISRIASWPSWTPPAEMRRRQPGLPITVSGGVLNPLGAKALYLGSTIYRIHGTNNPRSIGRASSSGCFRMMNEHVTHLATISPIGTKVRVMHSYSGVSEGAPMWSLFAGASTATQSDSTATKRKKAE